MLPEPLGQCMHPHQQSQNADAFCVRMQTISQLCKAKQGVQTHGHSGCKDQCYNTRADAGEEVLYCRIAEQIPKQGGNQQNDTEGRQHHPQVAASAPGMPA